MQHNQLQTYFSLLDTQSKLLNEILNTRLTYYVEHHIINNGRQHGFGKHRSTHTALATVYEKLANIKQHKHFADIILRDVSMAFHKVWHTGLKQKIHQLGIHTCFTCTLIDCITDRTAFIQIDEHTGPLFTQGGMPFTYSMQPIYTHTIFLHHYHQHIT